MRYDANVHVSILYSYVGIFVRVVDVSVCARVAYVMKIANPFLITAAVEFFFFFVFGVNDSFINVYTLYCIH